MALKAEFKLVLDDWATMPTMDDFVKYFSRPVTYEARKVEAEYAKIVKKFSSKKSKRVKLLYTKARLANYKNPPGEYYRLKNGKAIISVFGTNSTRTPLVWLEWGTTWRARRMSYDWVSKTTPGSLTVGAGKGYARRGKNAWGRLPGIEARNWRHLIADKRYDLFYHNVQAGFDAMLLAKNMI
ncbi:MAG: hypothetical protein DRI46_07815 [Chloroflexi bacterium]|nr:MAG: hypothetical protein DRI46_07815 [Chloroflexota bacterium]